MSAIRVLWQNEPLRMDPEILAAIYVELGEARAQAAIACATEELAVTLGRMRGQMRDGRLQGLSQAAARVHDIAAPLGLCSLARVAGDVAKVARRGDEVALGATLARLERVANRALKLVWDLQDLSG